MKLRQKKSRNINKKFKWMFFIAVSVGAICSVGAIAGCNSGRTIIKLADPTIFHREGIYYLYGTGGDKEVDEGFLVYTSTDLKNWTGPAGSNEGYALKKGDVFGEDGFWAPQVFHHGDKFYMFYTASQHIAVAVSNSPLGPFSQQEKKPLIRKERNIDPYVFIDDDGTKYLYHVIVADGGNRIYVAALEDDLSAIKDETLTKCIEATAPWENIEQAKWSVIEGPTVVKQEGLYYLFYSANHFQSKDYAVGYAVSESPFGPWKKHESNPILGRHNTHKNGSGHGDLFVDTDGNWKYVFHTHYTENEVIPRKTALINVRFNDKDRPGFSVDQNSFHYLHIDKR